MDIGAEKYVEFTTYKKDGTPIGAPVWIVALDNGQFAFNTGANSFKVKRLRRNPRIELAPTTIRGKTSPSAPRFSGVATVSTQTEDLQRVHTALRAKYGWKVPLIDTLEALHYRILGDGRKLDIAVVLITLDNVLDPIAK